MTTWICAVCGTPAPTAVIHRSPRGVAVPHCPGCAVAVRAAAAGLRLGATPQQQRRGMLARVVLVARWRQARRERRVG